MAPKKRRDFAASAPLISGEYMDMLKDYRRASKRQRSAQTTQTSETLAAPDNPTSSDATPVPQGSALDQAPLSFASDTDSDQFEDVDLETNDPRSPPHDEQAANDGDLVVTFDESQAKRLVNQKKPSSLSKPVRLALHKVSLAAWLLHARERNKWLLDRKLLENPDLSSILPQKVLVELFPPDHLTPFLKSKQLLEGIRHAMEVWQEHFTVARLGLTGAGSNSSEVGDSGCLSAYCAQLLSLSGSVDLMGQGFVALLRSHGLRVRLVCSLQPPDNLGSDQQSLADKTRPKSSDYPVFWAEVWDRYVSKWVAADPVTFTLKPPTRNRVKLKLEPPQSDRLNVLRYCIALDHDNSIRDVTRRYASSFNARTRKKRLPHFERNGWLDHYFGLYARKQLTPLDQDELKELSRYPRLEGIPSKVQDFVGHPEYALADHLRHDEVLRPDVKPCGVVSVKSKGAVAQNTAPIYIYRREDVLIARSAQSWYKRGLKIRVGAQPRGFRDRKDRLTGERERVALYSEEQTELYVPEPVTADGEIPKSQYRTIDVFTPWMIPKGAHHLKSKYAVQAAKLLKVDYANVVIGVDYSKRGPQSRYLGIVVARPFAAAVDAVVRGLREQDEIDAERQEELRILLLWRKFIMGVQIWERVEHMNPSMPSMETHSAPAAGHVGNSESNTTASTSNFDVTPNETKAELPSGDPLEASEGSDNENEIEILEEKRIPSRRVFWVNPAKAFARLRSLQSRVFEEGNMENKGLVKPESTHARLDTEANEPSKEACSPDSHHSFSDLDVDEISESDL